MNKSILIIILAILSCKNHETAELNDSAETIITDKSKTTFNSLKCEFETYLVYNDSVALYSEPSGKIFRYFKFEDDPEYDFGGGFLFKNSNNGWMQIGKDEFHPELENYWIHSKHVQIGTNNYNNEKIPLFAGPKKESKQIGFINEESYLNVIDCHDNWAFVEKKGTKGWLAPEFICNNSETNCN